MTILSWRSASETLNDFRSSDCANFDMGLYLSVREGSLSGFSDIRKVALCHAVGMLPSCMEYVKSLAK